jgi:hypothetical protein
MLYTEIILKKLKQEKLMLKKTVLTLSIVFISALGFAESSIGKGDWGIAVRDVLGESAPFQPTGERIFDGTQMQDVELTPSYDKSLFMELHYFLTDSFAVKPGVSISIFESDALGDASIHQAGFLLGFDFYKSVSEKMSLYAGCLFGYSIMYVNLDENPNYDAYQMLAAPRIGAQYMITENLGLFTDIGLYYQMTQIKPSEQDSKNIEQLKTMNSGIGVVFYF